MSENVNRKSFPYRKVLKQSESPVGKKISNTSSPVSHVESVSPVKALISKDLSIKSMKIHTSGPLSEVTSLIPTEILPEECPHSQNPSVNYFFERAFAASQNHEYQTAVKMYKKVIACEPNHFESWINIGICMMKQELHAEAINSFDNAIKANKNSFIPYYNKALDFISVSDFISALQCMDTASFLFPDPPPDLQKIRTFAIFKSGKISSALVNSEDKESPDPQKFENRIYSPITYPLIEKQRLVPRRMTMPVGREIRKKAPSKGYLKDFTKVEELDTRTAKTALSFPITRPHEKHYSSASPARLSQLKTTKAKGYNWNNFLTKEFFEPKKRSESLIYEMNIKENKTNDPIILKKIRDKLNAIEDKLLEYLVKKFQKSFSDPEWVNKAQLTQKEVTEIVNFLESREPEDYAKLDKILENCDFFSGFPEEYRQKLYEMSSIYRFEKDARVFSQGNAAHMVYVLLKGRLVSVIDLEKSEINSATEFLRYSRTLSAEKKNIVTVEYRANCLAKEDSFLLAFPTAEYQILLSELLKTEIEERVCFMINLPLFKGIDPIMLIPLAWHIDKEKYFEGQTIIKKNEIPKGLIVIYNGYCGIYTTGLRVRNRIGSEFANIKIRRPKPASFYTGNLELEIPNDYKKKIKRITNKSNENLNNLTYKTIEKIEHGLLQSGDYFGGRVLLEQKYVDLESKFTVVAETKKVEVLVITKLSMQYLQEKIAGQLKAVLLKTQDLDSPPDVDPDELFQNFLDWQHYKNDVIDLVQRNKFVNSKKFQFPYLR